jgi:rhodanese-related sulfurtransferase
MLSISVSELHATLKTINVIDVRTRAEHDESHIEQSLWIPLDEFSYAHVAHMVLPIAIYCRSGKRSAYACSVIQTTDPSRIVYNVTGGILAWEQAGFPVRKRYYDVS